MTPLNIYIGWDGVEAEAFHVLCHSIFDRSTIPVRITPIVRGQLPLTRPRHPKQSNAFAFTRFLVPYLNNYEGWALWLDADMMVRSDISDLFWLRDESKAVMVAKHTWEGYEGEKFLGTTQTSYNRKLWSAAVLFNCAKCKVLTPEYVDTADGLDLHQFKWLPDHEIGEIPVEWAWVADVYPHNPGANLVHWTLGGPYFAETANCDYADEWRIQRDKALWTKQR